ncbi:exported hypothetical protein [Vibrio chagasii]|uniref:Outer membrane protein beta-barrel domain-containing protein n=1 Tax=Vibrio crassostreae TaxID=246167 RepID=A0A822MQC8_9VIBR|nr:hypothetical protein [Vibrio crassostreae]CAH6821624.1 exported hypothetical protein [Vibrio chagasii]MDH5950442.1 hypothetical protein [Vibrio crassostreae]TCN06116.1 hypothetical protein EDB35_11495 [Vibrio crassostreae]TCT41302.1 hypothetical protein EDB29_10395 [Vibrio crassostreae]TCU05473.1 hypothetical protein EDB32_11660 [Vibrio crassostreae]
MKRNLLIASIAVAASMPASAMVKEYSIGVGISETQGQLKGRDFSGLEPTVNLGLTFDNNIMIGTGFTTTGYNPRYQSRDISNGMGGVISSYEEHLKLSSAINLRLGYKFETDIVNIMPYFGATAFSYKYSSSNKVADVSENLSDTAYIPFIGAEFSHPDYPLLSMGFRLSDKKSITNGVELTQGGMVTFSVNL